MNISESTGLLILSAIGLALTGAIASMWVLFVNELKECKQDRTILRKEVEDLNDRMMEISQQLGRMEGHMEHIDERQDQAHEATEKKQAPYRKSRPPCT